MKTIIQSSKNLLFSPGAVSSWAERRDFVIAILGWVVISIIAVWILAHFSGPFILLMIAVFLAYALSPAINFLDKYLARPVSIFIVYVIVFIGFMILLYFIVNTAVQQFSMLNHTISSLISERNQGAGPIMNALKKFGISQTQIQIAISQIASEAEKLTSSIVPLLTSIFSSIVNILIISILSIYLLIDSPKVSKWLKNNVPLSQQYKAQFFISTFKHIIGSYIRGQLLLALIVGLLVGIGMAILHVPYAVLLGVLAFILEFIPILGTIISATICIFLALTQGTLITVLVIIYFIAVHIIEGDILGPRIVGNALGLHPLVSILALIAGSELYGITGALFASPVAGLAQAILVAIWLEWKHSHPEAFQKNLAQ